MPQEPGDLVSSLHALSCAKIRPTKGFCHLVKFFFLGGDPPVPKHIKSKPEQDLVVLLNSQILF